MTLLMQLSKNCVIMAILAMNFESFTGSSSLDQRGGSRCAAGAYCRCPESRLLLDGVHGDSSAGSIEDGMHRCAKCEERKKEERARLAHNIIASVAQFFQGMVTLASSGKEADEKLKAEQCALMAQAVGNLIYQAHEHHRCSTDDGEITEGADSCESSTLNKNLRHCICYVVADYITENPEYCRALLGLLQPNI